jgi:alkanesulfonate monooxygenase SsuD/methylene tetrahydromethanopterin reductase-like flavin-dependent oxidoreductase (luciferase family)
MQGFRGSLALSSREEEDFVPDGTFFCGGTTVPDLQFGVFDHMDRGASPPAQMFRERLRLLDTYEQGGFYSYHVAEHHSTPLGLAPSPGLYLAAVAERTQRLRFGPMVYLLPMYHPLRLAEEVTMLDQLSGGRLDLGIGTGISPVELATFNIDKSDTPEMFDEVLAIMKQAWTQERVNHVGKRWRFDDVPVVSHPVQQPYPPLFYGVGHPEAVASRLAAGFNLITLITGDNVRGLWTSPEARQALGGDTDRILGLYRYVVVHRDRAKAMEIGRRAYRRWEESFHFLWRAKGLTPVFGVRPGEFDGMVEGGAAFAGNPDEVTAAIRKQLDESGSNYLCGQFVFGDMTEAEGRASIELFVTDVMPALRKAGAAAR